MFELCRTRLCGVGDAQYNFNTLLVYAHQCTLIVLPFLVDVIIKHY